MIIKDVQTVVYCTREPANGQNKLSLHSSFWSDCECVVTKEKLSRTSI